MDHNRQPGAVGSDDRFAGWAQQYEDDVLSRLLTALQRRAVARLRLTAADRFLDVGCATGAAVREASATVGLAVGVDRSAAMVRRARSLAQALPGTGFVVADAGRLPFPPSFSAVLSTTTLRHLADPVSAVREMARVLRPGGRMVVADFLACGTDGGRRWRNGPRRPGRGAPRVNPLRAVSLAPVEVTEADRFATAFGFYEIVSAAKPTIPGLVAEGWWPRRRAGRLTGSRAAR